MIPISSIIPSTSNPRGKHVDPVKLQELADSIVSIGRIIEPLIVREMNWPLTLAQKRKHPRPLDSMKYELVAGSRRLAAAVLAGLTEVPCVALTLTDQQVLEIQIIENLQREDVHPLFEAEGFARLLKFPDYTVDVLAEKVGKDRSHIYKRLQLTHLIEPLKKLFFDDAINIGHALLLCRIPEAEQKKAAVDGLYVREWLDGRDVRSVGSVEHLNRWLKQHVFLSLSAAPWKKDDADLVPAAGSCTACPKRTGANLELFDDVKKGDDRCLDGKCFDGKMRAYIERECFEFAAQTPTTPLVKVIDGYVELGSRNALPKGIVQSQDWRDAGKKTCPHVEDAIVAAGSQNIGKRIKICRQKNCKVHSYFYSAARSTADIWREKQRALESKIKLDAQRAAVATVVGKVKTLGKVELAAVVPAVIRGAGEEMAEYLGLEHKKHEWNIWKKVVAEVLDPKNADELARNLVAAALLSDVGNPRADESIIAPMAKAYRVDLKAIERAVGKELRAGFQKRKAAALKKAKTKPAKAARKK